MIIKLCDLASNRWFDPVKFEEFARRPENAKFLNDDFTVSTYWVDDLIRAYREFTGEAVLEADRKAIQQMMYDPR